jgi:hypothetical protein
VVERSAVNRLVVGSNPTSGAIFSGLEALSVRLQVIGSLIQCPIRMMAGSPGVRSDYSLIAQPY